MADPDINLLPTYIQYCQEIADSIEDRGHHPISSATGGQMVLVNAKDLAAFLRQQAVRRTSELMDRRTKEVADAVNAYFSNVRGYEAAVKRLDPTLKPELYNCQYASMIDWQEAVRRSGEQLKEYGITVDDCKTKDQ